MEVVRVFKNACETFAKIIGVLEEAGKVRGREGKWG
jgi:hypothetical protein